MGNCMLKLHIREPFHLIIATASCLSSVTKFPRIILIDLAF